MYAMEVKMVGGVEAEIAGLENSPNCCFAGA